MSNWRTICFGRFLLRIRIPLCLVLLAPALCGGASAARAQNCTPPSGATRVDDNYNPSATGNWWRITQYEDSNSDQQIDALDYFNWRYGNGLPVKLADPTVMKLTSEYGTWFYVTGTWLGNFPIYRTQDFRTFTFHMYAFDEQNLNGSNQWRDPVEERLYINNKWYENLWAPHLYIDPTHGTGPYQTIYLSFTGSESSTSTNDQSVFLSALRRSEFLAWHTKNPVTDDGGRFDDARLGSWGPRWYYYNPTNSPGSPYYYDGGFSVGRAVPTSGAPLWLTGPGCGWLEARLRGWAHRCHGAVSFMTLDSAVFFDPNRDSADPWKRVFLYNWVDANADVPFWQWGNHIAAHPILTNHFQLDQNFSAIPMAMCRNTNNKVSGLDNGTVNVSQQAWEWGGVAEAPSAIYLPQTNRYYLIYSRNTWDSAAYQVVYRMTAPGATFSSIQLPWFLDAGIPEQILLRANDFTAGGLANFGGAEAFTVKDSSGTAHPYVLFHCKLDYEFAPGVFTGRRTFFMKELTVANVTTGQLVQLKETSTDPKADIRLFRIPRCREP